MIEYEGTVYRPPSEARSLIIQATVGCSHNRCSFCNMYKDKQFKIRPLEAIQADLHAGRAFYPQVERIFLADGDALIMPTKQLLLLLQKCRDIYPECQRIGIYATPKSALLKSPTELTALYEAGLSIVYLGVESGSDYILQKINKGATQDQIVTAGQKLKSAGLKLSITLISGLGGKEYWQEHAQASGKIMDLLQPNYVGLLTLLLEEGTDLYNQSLKGEFIPLTPLEVLQETKCLLENVHDLNNCIFRSNHVSNYLALAGTLIQDKQRLLESLSSVLKQPEQLPYKHYRRL